MELGEACVAIIIIAIHRLVAAAAGVCEGQEWGQGEVVGMLLLWEQEDLVAVVAVE